MPKKPTSTIEIVEIKKVNTGTKNSYRVPKKQWDKWSERAKCMFNTVYTSMAHNQDLFKHPKQKAISLEFWHTTAWNAAWTAADECDKYVPAEV